MLSTFPLISVRSSRRHCFDPDGAVGVVPHDPL